MTQEQIKKDIDFIDEILFDLRNNTVGNAISLLKDWKHELQKEYSGVSKGVELIAQERKRQLGELGYTRQEDEKYTESQLAFAAATYAIPDHLRQYSKATKEPHFWPWNAESFKPAPRVVELRKAGALIAAEIDRLINSDKS